jgi:hypothetical protein
MRTSNGRREQSRKDGDSGGDEHDGDRASWQSCALYVGPAAVGKMIRCNDMRRRRPPVTTL